MKFEITFADKDARLVQSVFTFLGTDNVEEQNERIKQLIFEWVYKMQYEMARQSKHKAGKE